MIESFSLNLSNRIQIWITTHTKKNHNRNDCTNNAWKTPKTRWTFHTKERIKTKRYLHQRHRKRQKQMKCWLLPKQLYLLVLFTANDFVFISFLSVFHSKTISFFVLFRFSFDRTQIYGCLYTYKHQFTLTGRRICFVSMVFCWQMCTRNILNFLLIVICTIRMLYKCTFPMNEYRMDSKPKRRKKIEQRIDLYIYKQSTPAPLNGSLENGTTKKDWTYSFIPKQMCDQCRRVEKVLNEIVEEWYCTFVIWATLLANYGWISIHCALTKLNNRKH